MRVQIGVALALAGLLAGSSAHAAISAGSQGQGQPAGELFLAVWDPVNQISYTRDLGVDVLQPDFTSAQFSFSADALFTNTFAGSNFDNLRYSVVGANNDLVNEFVLGIWTTSNSANVDIAVNQFSALNTMTQNVFAYTVGVNEAAGTSDFSADVSSVIDDTTDPGYYGNEFTFDETLGSLSAFNTGANIGDALAFYSLIISNDTGGQLAVEQLGSWNLSLDGDLTYGNAQVVPVPPAIWMFASALAAFFGMRRRHVADA